MQRVCTLEESWYSCRPWRIIVLETLQTMEPPRCFRGHTAVCVHAANGGPIMPAVINEFGGLKRDF